MYAVWSLVNLLVFIQIVTCRDFYLGMFRRNDFLVAQDVIYKAPAPFGSTIASYGRFFKCPITYFRVVDRLGMGRGPITTIVRGGLRKKFIAVRIKSTYRLPVSVNIYVGCENKKPSTFRTTLTTTTMTSAPATTKETGGDSDDDDVTTTPAGDDDETSDGSEATTTDGSDSVTTVDDSKTTVSTASEDDSSTKPGNDNNTASTGPGDDSNSEPGKDNNTAITGADDTAVTTTDEPPT